MGIIEVGGYAGAISAVIALIIAICKTFFIFKKSMEHNKENYMAILRLTIVSKEMPLSERIAAGDIYVGLNGNGQVKALYKKLLDESEKENKT